MSSKLRTELATLARHLIACGESIQRLVSTDYQQETPISRIKRRAGRKSMSAVERLAVSARMKQYWETRRKAK